MTSAPQQSCRLCEWTGVFGRWLLGGLFIYMGLSKALNPVDFLKLVREYDIVHNHLLLNSIAAALPWFEVFCGLLIAAGVAVRGTVLVVLGMLIPFTVLVWIRAAGISNTLGIPFCAVKFNCGCGAGEVLICRKLAENFGLMFLSLWLLTGKGRLLSACFSLVKAPREQALSCAPAEGQVGSLNQR